MKPANVETGRKQELRKADLHIHSTISDGSFSMEQIAERAVKKGLDVIAFTEHDTVSHFNKLPVFKQLTIIGGIEISAFDSQRKVKAHILGYGIRNPLLLHEAVRPTLIARHENCMMQIQILREHGYSIDSAALMRADGTYIYKQHIMEYLVRTKQAEEMFGAFYQQTFKNGGICDFDITYPDPFTAVAAVKKAGGVAVLAHSGQQQNFDIIPGLVECGLDGLELNHPSHTAGDKKKIKEYAEKYHLFLTGGSDFHGAFEKNSADLGEFLAGMGGIEAVLGEKDREEDI